jgi:hypothetical protein
VKLQQCDLTTQSLTHLVETRGRRRGVRSRRMSRFAQVEGLRW